MAERPSKQHLISKVLLRRFASTEHEGQLRAFDLRYGHARLRHPSAVAWRPDFIEHNPVEAEALWRSVENELGAALMAVEDGTALESPQHIESLCLAIALHFIRRDLVKEAMTKSIARMEERVAQLQPEHVTAEATDELRTWLTQSQDQIIAEQFEMLFDRARGLVSGRSVEVIYSPESPLLIGDRAVLSMQNDAGVGFVPFARAATHVLPVGRHHLVALARESSVFEVSARVARQLNEFQITQARRHVFFHPDDELEAFINETRQKHVAAAPSARCDVQGRCFGDSALRS